MLRRESEGGDWQGSTLQCGGISRQLPTYRNPALIPGVQVWAREKPVSRGPPGWSWARLGQLSAPAPTLYPTPGSCKPQLSCQPVSHCFLQQHLSQVPQGDDGVGTSESHRKRSLKQRGPSFTTSSEAGKRNVVSRRMSRRRPGAAPHHLRVCRVLLSSVVGSWDAAEPSASVCAVWPCAHRTQPPSSANPRPRVRHGAGERIGVATGGLCW